MLQAWTEVCYQIAADWEVQTMWNLLKNVDVYGEVCFSQKIFTYRLNISLPQWAWVKKTVCEVETHWLFGKEKVLGIAVNKEDHADSLLGHERTHHYWFPLKRCNSKQYFFITNSVGKTHLIYWMTLIYIYPFNLKIKRYCNKLKLLTSLNTLRASGILWSLI